jgi:hypothetical protein
MGDGCPCGPEMDVPVDLGEIDGRWMSLWTAPVDPEMDVPVDRGMLNALRNVRRLY